MYQLVAACPHLSTTRIHLQDTKVRTQEAAGAAGLEKKKSHQGRKDKDDAG